MKHIDGIDVSITTPCGSRLPEWPNPCQKRHPDFDGSLGSRQVVGRPGTPFEVVVEFDTTFKLYSATGVVVIIVIGDKSSQLSRDDNCQVFWLDGAHIDIRKKHRFAGLALWHDEGNPQPSEHVQMEMPGPNRELQAWYFAINS